MQEAGIDNKKDGSMVTESERQALLAYLKRSHGEDADAGDPKKITLKRKSTSQLKVSGASGKRKTVNIEVRKKRTYVKREELEDKPEEVSAEEPAAVAQESALKT